MLLFTYLLTVPCSGCIMLLCSVTNNILESFGSILLCIDRIYVSDIMPFKHNSSPSIIYLVFRLQCFDPLLGHHQTYIKTESVLHLTFYVPNGIRVVYRVVYSLYSEQWKKWKVECSNTQHILCSVCPKFLVEFELGVGGRTNYGCCWWNYKWPLQRADFLLFVLDVRSLVCRNWGCVVEYAAYKDMWSMFLYIVVCGLYKWLYYMLC
jgi:hypothetical protein